MPVLNKTKIPKEQEENVCNLYLSGLSSLQIANIYDCSSANICNICKRYGISRGTRHPDKITTKCNENYFENIDTPDKAYFVGFIISDGHVGKNKEIKIRLNIKDIEILERFNKYLESDYKIQQTKEYDKRTDKFYELCALMIYRDKLADDLHKLGINNNKSEKLDLPNISNHLIKFMIRGICDGDGGFHINEKNTCNFKLRSSTKSVLEQVQSIFIKEAGLNKVSILFDSGCYALQYGGNINIRKIYNYLYDDLQHDLYLTRKYKYIKHHMDNLDFDIKSRYRDDKPISQYDQTFREGILLF